MNQSQSQVALQRQDKIDPDVIKFLSAIWEPGEVREIRAKGRKPWETFMGFFDNPRKAAIEVTRLLENKTLKQIYVLLNPAIPSILARAANRIIQAEEGKSTKDHNVELLKYLLIDVDCIPIPDISATDSELNEALEISEKIIEYLGKPLVHAVSGNGIHLIYRHNLIDNSRKNIDRIKAFLHFLDEKFAHGTGHLDLKVYNPSRITKVIGTYARKGDSIPDRPHRKSRLISISDDGGTVVKIPETAIQMPAKKADSASATSTTPGQSFDVRAFLAEHGVIVKKEKPWNDAVLLVLSECIFDASHRGGEAAIVIHPDGKFTYQCFHNSCDGRTWSDVRQHIGSPRQSDNDGRLHKTCRFCGEQIFLMLDESDNWKPFNPDESRHNCRQNGKKTTKKAKRQRKQKKTVSKDSTGSTGSTAGTETEGGQVTGQVTGQSSTVQAADPAWLVRNDSGKPSVITGLASVYFFSATNDNLIYAQENFWEYDGKSWQPLSDGDVSKTIQEMIANADLAAVKRNTIEDILYQVRNLARKTIQFDQDKWKICLENGVFDLNLRELLPHNRNFYQSINLPFPYLEGEKCPRWLLFLDEIFPDDLYTDAQAVKSRLQEWAGYCLIPSPRLEKCLYLFGGGSNGKSVLLSIIKALIGSGNWSAIEPGQLFQQFQLAGIMSKLINVCADINTKSVLSEEFKKIVSGDPCTTDIKNKAHISFCPFAKHLFSANDFIPTRDRTEGFFRRFDVIEFRKHFSEKDRDEFLQEKLLNELPGIFLWALDGLFRLIENGWKMTASPDFEATKDRFKRESSPLAIFIEENCTDLQEYCAKFINPDEWQNYIRDHSYLTKDFRTVYVQWCREGGYSPLSDVHLGRELQNIGIERKKIMRNGKRQYVYYGLSTGMEF